MPTKIQLCYGNGHQTITIPSGFKFKVLSAKEPNPIKNFSQSLALALNHPIAAKPFDALFGRNDKIAIVIPDKTRRCQSDKVLAVIINRLNRKGINDKSITIILSRGIHAGHTPDEIRKLVGPKVYKTVRIIDHDAKNDEQLTYIGTTSYGTRVELNKYCVTADKVITVGTIGYHYFAGFSGGRKLILPGIAGYNSVQQNHSLVLNKNPLCGKNPNACLGKLDANPVNEDMVEGARMLGVDFSINLILNGKNEIMKIFCGDIFKSHRKGCEFLKSTHHINTPYKADLIIASAGGFPTDINFIQTHKTMELASYALKEDGKMLVLAECREGIGSDTFMNWIEFGSIKRIENELRQHFIVHGHTALCTLIKSKKFDIYLRSKLKDSLVKNMCVRPVHNLQGTLNNIFSNMPLNAKIFVIPRGYALLPIVSRVR